MSDVVATPEGGVAPYSSTVAQPVDSTKSEWSKKVMDPEARAQMRAWLDAQDAQEKAQASPTLPANPTAADVDAAIKSHEVSQRLTDKADLAAQPDPFQPPAAPIPTMGGRPAMSPAQAAQATPQSRPDRPYTADETFATPQMRGPQNLAEATDEANAYKAQVQARLAKQQADELARIEADRQKRIADAMARSEAAAAQYAKAGAALYEEPSMFKRIGSAIALGFGAYGASLTGSPNFAMQILQNQQQRDTEIKKLRIEHAAKEMEMAGHSRQMVDDWAKQQEVHLATIQGAQLAALEADVTKRLAVFPQAQQAAAQKFAELKEKNAKDRFQAIQAATEGTTGGGRTNEGVKVTTVEGKPNMQARPRSASDIEEYSLYQQLDKKASRIDELSKDKNNVPTPDQIDDYTNRTNAVVANQIKESHGNAQILLGRLGRALDALPESAYPADMTPQQREWMRLHTEMVHQVGVKKFGQSAMSNPEQYHEFVGPLIYKRGDTQEEGVEKGRAMSDQMHVTWKNMEELSGAGEKRQAKDAAQARAQAGKSKLESPKSSQEMARRVAALPSADQVKAMEAFKVKKDDPRFESADKWLKNRGLR